MGRRLGRSAEALGVADVGQVLAAHAMAMEPRDRILPDDHHPHMLHPGRTALILLHDAEIRDPLLLSAGVLLESVWDELRVGQDDLRRIAGPDVADRVEVIPTLGGERLAEELLALEPPLLVVALAEHLDHLRHARLWEDLQARSLVERQARDVYAPLAERAHPKIAARYRAWQRLTKGRSRQEAP